MANKTLYINQLYKNYTIASNIFVILKKNKLLLKPNNKIVNNDLDVYEYISKDIANKIAMLTRLTGIGVTNDEIEKKYCSFIKPSKIQSIHENNFMQNIVLEEYSSKGIKISIKEQPAFTIENYSYPMLDENCDRKFNCGYFNCGYKYPIMEVENKKKFELKQDYINIANQKIANFSGDVLIYGLNIGYIAYMCSINSKIKSITIVEPNEDVINYFKENIYNQFSNKQVTIKIINNLECDRVLDDYDYCIFDKWYLSNSYIEEYLKYKNLSFKLKKCKVEFMEEEIFRSFIKEIIFNMYIYINEKGPQGDIVSRAKDYFDRIITYKSQYQSLIAATYKMLESDNSKTLKTLFSDKIIDQLIISAFTKYKDFSYREYIKNR